MNGGAPSVLVVTASASLFGGTERVLELLLDDACSRRTFAVAFLNDGPLVGVAKTRGIVARTIPRGRLRNPYSYLRTVRALRGFVHELRRPVVLAWSEFVFAYAGVAAAGVAPAVWWQRGAVEAGLTRILRFLPRAGVLANSRYTLEQLRAKGIGGRSRILYPVVESARFVESRPPSPELARQRLQLPRGGRWIGIVGRLQRWKGLHVFVDALAKLARTHPDVCGLIVGGRHDLEPGYEDELRGHVEALGLSARIRFVGPQRDVASYMAAMDVVVHASSHEPFGIVVPEAMALGRPVIAAVPGGPAEVISDGMDGLLVPSGDAVALSGAMARLLDDPVWAAELVARARVRGACFSSEGFAHRLLEAITSCCPEGQHHQHTQNKVAR